MTEIIDRAVECGGNAKLSVIPEMGHKSMDYEVYTQEVIDWIISQ